jgi:hypothetical protein
MKFAATLLFFLCSTLVAACSRPQQLAVSNGQQAPSQSRISYFSADPDDMSSHDFAFSKKVVLTCEPVGIIRIPKGTCLGTLTSGATMTPRGCLCQNEAYIAVPTAEGHTCVHLIAVLETVRSIVKNIEAQKITENDIPFSGHLSTAQIALQLVKSARSIDAQIRNNAPQARLDQQFNYITLAISVAGTVHDGNSECVTPPKAMRRRDIFAEYKPL